MPQEPKERLLRVQGPRSRGGCKVCKQRHVKCDETTPSCDRCVRAERICEYANQSLGPTGKIVIYTLPRNPTPLRLPSREQRALWHFQNRTIGQLEGSFRSDFWSIVIPRLAQNDIIVRQAVVALSIMHEHYLDGKKSDQGSLDMAVRYYQRARQQIIDLKLPDHSFDSILCACIVFSACEGLQGKFDQGMKHAVAGMKMISNQIKMDVWQSTTVASTGVSLFEVYLDLESRTFDANIDDHETRFDCPRLEEWIGEIPQRYQDPEDSMAHLQLLGHQFMQLTVEAEKHHETYPWTASFVSPALQPEYDAFSKNFDAWASAVSFIPVDDQPANHRRHSAHLLLQVYVSSFKIDRSTFLHGEETYDLHKEQNFDILRLIEKFVHLRHNAAGSKAAHGESQNPPAAYYAAYAEVIPILFEIATRTLDPQIRSQALWILRLSRWREDVWDSQLAANLAEQIVCLKQRGAVEVAQNRPGHKFLLSDIQLLSDQQCRIEYGFKRWRVGYCASFWLETIPPEDGPTYAKTLDITDRYLDVDEWCSGLESCTTPNNVVKFYHAKRCRSLFEAS